MVDAIDLAIIGVPIPGSRKGFNISHGCTRLIVSQRLDSYRLATTVVVG